MYTKVKTATEIEGMRESGKMLATIHGLMRKLAVPGISEKELADAAARELKALGGHPTFKGYGGPSNGFPDVICISTNDVVVHGIPGSYILQDGDNVSFDFGVTYRGMVTDSAITVGVGEVESQIQQLISDTEKSMMAGIETLHNGVRVGDIGAAVERVLNTGGYGIVHDLVGHGTGHQLHESPDIPNYGKAGTGFQFESGMTIAIEPMANLGTEKVVMDSDGWTIRTADGKRSAHWEHTVLITNESYEIITKA